MEFAVQIEPQFGYTYEDVRDIARDAEAAGFTALWVSDHLFLGPDAVATNCLEAWTLLAALARDTRTLRLGPLVTAQSYRNPALLAKIAAGVDHMSGGRLEFGVGAGWKDVEYQAYGYPFPRAGVRVEQLVDTLEICLRMWTEERPTYRGKHYSIENALCAPKPVQRPRPRVWIGGSQPRILRVIARYADGINVGGLPTPQRYAEVIAELERACKGVGRDPGAILRSHFMYAICAPTREAVHEIVDALAARANTDRATFLERRAGSAIGTPEEVVARLEEFAALGVRHVQLLFPYQREREMVRLVSERVMPAFA